MRVFLRNSQYRARLPGSLSNRAHDPDPGDGDPQVPDNSRKYANNLSRAVNFAPGAGEWTRRVDGPQKHLRGPVESRYLRVRVGGQGGPLPTAVACGVLALYFFVEAFAPFSLFRLALALLTGYAAWRLAQRTTLIASDQGITWYTTVRKLQWPYNAIDHFEIAERRGSESSSPREVLRIHLSDGRAQWLRGIEEPAGSAVMKHSPGSDRWSVAELADNLNAILSDLKRTTSARKAS